MPEKYESNSTPEANDVLGKLIEQMKHCWRQDPRERPNIKGITKQQKEWLSRSADLGEEVEKLKIELNNKLHSEDRNNYCVSFNNFCDQLRHKYAFSPPSSDSSSSFTLPGTHPKATVSERLGIDSANFPHKPGEGELIMIKTPDSGIECSVKKVY